jgi:tRNA-Thr(GGU) m(6)t(6)A37 methyltransferase TsaA
MQGSEINFKAVGFVVNSRKHPDDDHWEPVISEIRLADHVPVEAFDGISAFSHLEIIYFFDKVERLQINYSGYPRGNPAYPVMGIFAQRKKDRPNAIGLATVELIEHSGRTITVKYLDAIDGTPVLDIKPVIKEFGPQTEIRQPPWVSELMKNYWR